MTPNPELNKHSWLLNLSRAWPMILAIVAMVMAYTILNQTVKSNKIAIEKIEMLKADITYVENEIEKLKLNQSNIDDTQTYRIQSLEEMKQDVKIIEANIRKIMAKMNIEDI